MGTQVEEGIIGFSDILEALKNVKPFFLEGKEIIIHSGLNAEGKRPFFRVDSTPYFLHFYGWNDPDNRNGYVILKELKQLREKYYGEADVLIHTALATTEAFGPASDRLPTSLWFSKVFEKFEADEKKENENAK